MNAKELEMALVRLVDEYLETEQKIRDSKNLVLPEEPEKPHHCTIVQWEAFYTERMKWEEIQHAKTTGLSQLEKDRTRLFDELTEAMPGKNVWFVVGCYAIAHETNDWPMDKGKLFIHTDPDVEKLHEVKHRRVT